MNTPMKVSASEIGIVRLFAIDLAQGASFDLDDLSAALGDVTLDPEQVDLIDVAELEELGLYGYLRDGMGIPTAELDAARAHIAAHSGKVALLRSSAFEGRAVTLRPKSPLRWIASFGEVPLDLNAAPLRSDAAIGILAGGTPPAVDPKRKRTLLWIVLAGIAFVAFVAVLSLFGIAL